METINFYAAIRRCKIRLFNWEYWNGNLVYLPLLPYLCWLWIKSRSFFFFNAANPGIAYGGFTMESKWDIQKDVAPGIFPEAVRIDPAVGFNAVESLVRQVGGYPFIAKPDTGNKGKGVVVIHTREAWARYHSGCPMPYLIQEKIHAPLEAGIFYVRFPWEQAGCITGITQKEFIQVRGNGRDSLVRLLEMNPRYLLQIPALKKIISSEEWNMVLKAGEEKTVLSIGNHSRGAMFSDASNRITQQLNSVIDTLAKQIPGFYFGRLDIRFKSWEELEQGFGFNLIELNGAGSEPTHIYDPRHSIFFAWKEIIRHWNMLFTISRHHHQSGVRYLSFSEGLQLLRAHRQMEKELQAFNCYEANNEAEFFHMNMYEQPV